MSILPALAVQFQGLFPSSDHGRERARWFILTLQAILLPITAARTSSLLRTIATVFGVAIGEARFYTFMASAKLPWAVLWRAIPDPLTDGRLLLVLDDSINPKTGSKLFACQRSFDHAAKTNLKPLSVGADPRHGRTAEGRSRALVLSAAGLRLLPAPSDAGPALRAPVRSGAHLRDQVHPSRAPDPDPRGGLSARAEPGDHRQLVRQQRLAQALAPGARLRAHLLARLRVTAVLHQLPTATPGRAGRPCKYGVRLGSVKALAPALRATARSY
jgi:hypothetical protein